MFCITVPTFKRLITGFMEVLSPHAVGCFVSGVSRDISFSAIRESNVLFSRFLHAV